jgi:hypothetical protein
MRRFKDYLRFLVWNFGLGYIALWTITFWTLDHGQTVLGSWGGCAPDPNTVLFYWVCDSGSPFSILAAIANSALTITIWAPVYLAAATVRPEAIMLAVPIIGAHLIGLATAILVTIRLTLAFFQFVRRLPRGKQDRPAAAEPVPDAAMPRWLAARRLRHPRVARRAIFGLRQSAPSK